MSETTPTPDASAPDAGNATDDSATAKAASTLPAATAAAAEAHPMRRSLLVVLGVVAVLGMATLAWTIMSPRSAEPVRIYLANPLDSTITFRFGENRLALDPGKYSKVVMAPSPSLVMRAEIDGRAIDERTEPMPPGSRWFWSPAGAAPLTVWQGTSRVGRPLVGPEAVFVSLEDSIRVAFDEEDRPRQYDLRLETDCHWQVSLALLRGVENGPRLAADLATAVWRAEPDHPKAQELAVVLTASAYPPGHVVELGRQIQASGHATTVAQRLVLLFRLRSEPAGPLRNEMRAAFESAPDSATAALMVVMAERQARALELHEQFLVKWPDNPWLHRDHAFRLWVARRYDEAVAAYDRLMELDDRDQLTLMPYRVHALAALGRIDDAMALVDAVGARAVERRARDMKLAVTWSLLVQLRDGADADPGMRDKWAQTFLHDQHPGVWQRFYALSGLGDVNEIAKLPEGTGRTGLRIVHGLQTDPAAAVQLAINSDADVVRAVFDDVAALLLAGHLGSGGHADRARIAVQSVSFLDSDQRAAVESLVVNGTPSDLLDEIPVHLQAAVDVIRALRTADAAERTRWLDRAVAADPLGGVVARHVAALRAE